MVVAQRGDRVDVEGPTGSGCVPGRVELLGDLTVGEVCEAAGQIDRRRVRPATRSHRIAAGDDDLVGGAGVPPDPDAGLGEVGFREQGDVGDQGPQ